jgi:hypothetical protein
LPPPDPGKNPQPKGMLSFVRCRLDDQANDQRGD